MEINIKMFNNLNEEVNITNYDMDNLKDFTNIDLFVENISLENKNCTIKCKWREQSYSEWNFICLMPYNEKIDCEKVENGQMKLDEYQKKWYPRLYNSKILEDFKGIKIKNEK